MMDAGTLWALVILGILTSAILVFVIARQLRTLGHIKSKRASIQKRKNESQLDLRESLVVLSSSVLDGQVEVSEACMRIKILLDHFDPDIHTQEPFDVFNKVYERLEKMPRFGERKGVDKRVLAKLDQTRYRVEAQYEAEVFDAASALIRRLQSHPAYSLD